jgi:nucleotide-binding universal stress UspA family protein
MLMRMVQEGYEHDSLYLVHINKSEGKSRGAWKAAGPVIADLDRALQGYSYDIIEIQSDSAAAGLVQFAKAEAIDVLIISMGRSKSRLANPIQSRTTDYVASHAPCATLVIHPQARTSAKRKFTSPLSMQQP